MWPPHVRKLLTLLLGLLLAAWLYLGQNRNRTAAIGPQPSPVHAWCIKRQDTIPRRIEGNQPPTAPKLLQFLHGGRSGPGQIETPDAHPGSHFVSDYGSYQIFAMSSCRDCAAAAVSIGSGTDQGRIANPAKAFIGHATG